FHGWRAEPDVVRVVIREIARSTEVSQRVGELVKPIGAIRRIFERGQVDGDFRRDLDADTAAVIVYGAIDELITGWVLGRLAVTRTTSPVRSTTSSRCSERGSQR